MDIMKVGEAIRDIAAVMKNEPEMKCVGIVLPGARFRREDLEFLSFMATKEIACDIRYDWNNGKPILSINRKEEK